jgi:surfeit locus 1 family protein
MAKRQTDTLSASWVPAGLKVRADVSASNDGPYVSPALTFPPRPANDPIGYIVDPALEPLPELTPEHSTREPQQSPPKSSKPGFEPMPILSIVTVICLAILVILGSWQWDKFASKSNAPAQTTAIEPAPVAVALEASNPEYRPVVVEGLMDKRTIKVAAVQNSVRGYRLFSPVVMEVGSVFVDRGFIAEGDVARIAPITGQVSLKGVLRLGAKANAYTPDNEPARDVWYWPDLKAMDEVLMIQSSSEDYYVAQAQVDPLGTGMPILNPYADRKGANQIPPERHLGYALTWWGFGLALIGVYMGMHVRAGRLRFKRTPL